MQEHQDYGRLHESCPVAGTMMPSAGRCGEGRSRGAVKENGQQEPRAEAKWASQVALLLGSWWEVTAGTWGGVFTVPAQTRGLELLRQSWVNWGK